MFRKILLGAAALVVWAGALQAGEHIYLSGGPALRYFEKHKENSHDRFWGNFIQSAMARFGEWKGEMEPGDQFTWLIHRPGYVTRGREMGVDLIEKIETWVRPSGARIIWFTDRQELIDYLNQGQDRSRVPIKRFEYFGHSNKRNFMFDYSNRFDAAVIESQCLHQDHLRQIKRGIFSRDAYVKSWGCHSGEEYSKHWQKATGVPMIGAIGKTDYSNAAVPVLSGADGKWSQ